MVIELLYLQLVIFVGYHQKKKAIMPMGLKKICTASDWAKIPPRKIYL